MIFLRKILFLVIAISLSFSGLANAAVDCYHKKHGTEAVSMKVDMDKPCHGTEHDDTNNEQDSCNECGCQHCVSHVFVLPTLIEAKIKLNKPAYTVSDIFTSKILDDSLRPPKYIS